MTEMDGIIEEIRRSRVRMSEECGHDLHRYLEQLKAFNKRYAAQVRKYRRFRETLASSLEGRRGQQKQNQA